MKGKTYCQLALVAIAMIMTATAFGSPQQTISHRAVPELVSSSGSTLPSEEAYVPSGEYIRGCTEDTVSPALCFIESKPLQAVYLDAFYIDKTEVTNAQYASCVASGACAPPLASSSTTRSSYYGNPTYSEYPVIHVDWARAHTYCTWLGKRLPTEAEWEKAARGTDHRLFAWGNDFITCSKCNCNTWVHNSAGELREAPCVGDTSPVGGYTGYASPYGIYDIIGNVREWVNDLYAKHYFVDAPYYNPQGPRTTVTGEHLVRGGSWKDTYTHANTWGRLDEADIYQTHLIGFRCARDATGAVPAPSVTPTPIPHDASDIGPDGGALWIAPRDTLTVLAVPTGVLSSTEVVTLSYSVQDNMQGDLQGLSHFFRLVTEQYGGGDNDSRLLPQPVRVVLAYRGSYGVVRDTIDLYRVAANGWVTEGITKVAELPGYMVADVVSTGVYGLLGVTHRTYLPIVLR